MTTATKTRTALVTRPVTRCEFGSLAHGLMAAPLDRVTIVSSRSFSSGGTQYKCRTERGEVFFASSDMVQED